MPFPIDMTAMILLASAGDIVITGIIVIESLKALVYPLIKMPQLLF